MSNTIALIWDCDKTLIDGYMQDPIFNDYGVDSVDFWKEVNGIIDKYKQENRRINSDTYYLNHFIKCAHGGKFAGLNNKKLRDYGKSQKMYPGLPDFFKKTKEMFKDNQKYIELGIQVEHYIVSTGFAEVIRGMSIAEYVDDIWGCELLEENDEAGNPVISEVVYTIDNTTKTRAVFEINKGINKIEGIDVNSNISKENRRVQMENMIYIADGPSDIPAFSVVGKNGGTTLAVYPRGDFRALKQVEQMRIDGRVEMIAEADYSENTTVNMWLTEKINELAEGMVKANEERIKSAASSVPKHL